jgi:uncharacterized protein involved in response to NO
VVVILANEDRLMICCSDTQKNKRWSLRYRQNYRPSDVKIEKAAVIIVVDYICLGRPLMVIGVNKLEKVKSFDGAHLLNIGPHITYI